ncbi:MAG: 3-ketoacyl-ACP reductase [Thermoguttaceae bacterium]
MSDKPVAIVTGASRGIGKAIALELAALGYDLAICFKQAQTEQSTATAAQREIETAGAECLAFRADISDAADREKLVAAVENRFSRCDMLVNNAGVGPLKRVDILQSDEASFERVMKINLQGPYFLTQLVARWMIRQLDEHPQRKCRVVNIGSISAYASSPSRGEYCVSKAGIGMMTALYANRLAEYGIGVFEIRPGIIATDMTAAVKDKYDKMIAEGLTPIRRWGTPQDVARAVGAIAEGRLDFSTGAVIGVDGGFQIRRL